MREKMYKQRAQPKSRRKYGELERKRDLVKRLAKINKQKEDIKKAKEEIRNKSGQEYFFGYHSLKRDGSGIHRVDDPTIDELVKIKAYIDNEIQRSVRRLEKYVPRPRGTHIKFEEDSEERGEMDLGLGQNEETRREFERYVSDLAEKRKEVVRRIDELRGVE